MKIKQLKLWISDNLLVISIILIVVGFVIMAIGNSAAVNGNTSHQLIIAPILLISGYSLVIFAIMNRKKY